MSFNLVTVWLIIGDDQKDRPPRYANEENDCRRASSRGIIPRAKIKTVKMTFVIVFGKYNFIPCLCFMILINMEVTICIFLSLMHLSILIVDKIVQSSKPFH